MPPPAAAVTVYGAAAAGSCCRSTSATSLPCSLTDVVVVDAVNVPRRPSFVHLSLSLVCSCFPLLLSCVFPLFICSCSCCRLLLSPLLLPSSMRAFLPFSVAQSRQTQTHTHTHTHIRTHVVRCRHAARRTATAVETAAKSSDDDDDERRSSIVRRAIVFLGLFLSSIVSLACLLCHAFARKECTATK